MREIHILLLFGSFHNPIFCRVAVVVICCIFSSCLNWWNETGRVYFILGIKTVKYANHVSYFDIELVVNRVAYCVDISSSFSYCSFMFNAGFM